MALPDIEKLTEEEQVKLAEACLEILSLEERVGVVVRVFGDRKEKEELLSWLEDETE